MRFAKMPTLVASAEASSIESTRSVSIHLCSRRYQDLRVVMIIAFPTATFRNVFHISRFIFASIPVENSSMRIHDGFPETNHQSALEVLRMRAYVPMSAIARDSFRWFPPESLLARRSAYKWSDVACIKFSTLLFSSSPR